MEMLPKLITFHKKPTDKKIYIDDKLYVKFGTGVNKYIGLYEVVREYKTVWKAYLGRLTHEEWKQLNEQGRIRRVEN